MPALAVNSSNARLALPLFLEFIVAHSITWLWIESSDRRIRNTDKSFSSVKIKQDPSKLKIGFYSFKPIWLQRPSLETVSKKRHSFANGEISLLDLLSHRRNLASEDVEKIQYMDITPELTPSPLSPILNPIKPFLKSTSYLDLEGTINEVPQMPDC